MMTVFWHERLRSFAYWPRHSWPSVVAVAALSLVACGPALPPASDNLVMPAEVRIDLLGDIPTIYSALAEYLSGEGFKIDSSGKVPLHIRATRLLNAAVNPLSLEEFDCTDAAGEAVPRPDEIDETLLFAITHRAGGGSVFISRAGAAAPGHSTSICNVPLSHVASAIASVMFVVYELSTHEFPVADREHCDRLLYPVEAMQVGGAGKVLLMSVVGPDGRVRLDTTAFILYTHPAYANAMLRFLSTCEFEPLIEDGEPVQRLLSLGVDFSTSY